MKFTMILAVPAMVAALLTPKSASANDAIIQGLYAYEAKALIDYAQRITPLITYGREAQQLAGTSFKMTDEYLDQMARPRSTKSIECMAEALYFEARGEKLQGQFAVAEVIKNRVSSPRFPDSVCAVINQGTGRKFACQFTYTCDGRPEYINNTKVHEKLRKIAALVLGGEVDDITKGATFYHTRAVNPRWASVFERTRSIGAHHFYRQS